MTIATTGAQYRFTRRVPVAYGRRMIGRGTPRFDRSVQLRPDGLSVVESLPGVYAAWVADEKALRAAGIDGPAPRCMYVGKAEGSGLQARIGQHVESTFLSLNEILAVRGLALFSWADRFRPPSKAGTKYYVERTPLTAIAHSDTKRWQQDYFRWSWVPMDQSGVRDREREAILDLKPLLNVVHGGKPVPQLRACAGYKTARARWLWHASWMGLPLPRYHLRSHRAEQHWPQSDPHRRRTRLLNRSPKISVAVDQDGFLVPVKSAARDGATAHVIKWPSDKAIRSLMEGASGHAVRDIQEAVSAAKSDELRSWWAAHAGASYLRRGVSVKDAIAASLSRAPRLVDGNDFRLPTDVRIEDLLELVAALNRVRH